MDYKKRDMNRLVKAYDLIYDVDNGYYDNLIEVKNLKLQNLTDELEDIFEVNGYDLVIGSNDKYKLVKKK